MKRITVLVALSCLLPGCTVRQNLEDGEPATPAKTPAQSAASANANKTSDGNKQQASETRKTAAFHKIELDGAYNLTVDCQKDSDLQVSAESNLLPLILTEVRDDTLHIYSKQSINSHSPATISVSIPTLSALRVNGSGNSDIRNLKDNMMLEISGSGNAKLAGRTPNFRAQISGSGNIEASGLIADDVNVDISGSGNAKVHADKTLNVVLAGSGSVVYSGGADVRKQIAGSGRVTKQ